MHSFSTRIKQLSDVWAGLWSLVSEAAQLLQEVAHVLYILYVGLTKVRFQTGPREKHGKMANQDFQWVVNIQTHTETHTTHTQV